ncbi:hypothetical protein F5X68DRAFT_239519 [Plectosphaerella plurivora]|uniref:Uncharacterized protein n=1 Tax=Plectosphaerella plurivora TaxID=936078 RepID=A0A9P8VCG2_9PEZI|nr:hypothetical protein F5X68DRAFT_239519 [Plectosphaerella plurivora]
MFGLVLRNGYVAALMSLRDNGPHLLPGSQHLILTTFTGIPPLDKLLTLGGVMFASVTSGALPQLSLSVLWGCAMQTIGAGFVMPIYGIAHLLTSGTALEASTPLVDAADITDEEALKLLPKALWLGYILPTILMVAPIPWNTLHQWLGGFWQGFPMWVALAQHALVSRRREVPPGRPGKVAKRQPGDNEPLRRTHSSSSGNRMSTMHTLQGVYWFAFKACAVSHWTTMAIIAANTLASSWFPQRLRGSLSFAKVFWPPAFWNPDPMESMAHGIHSFFQYDLDIFRAVAQKASV